MLNEPIIAKFEEFYNCWYEKALNFTYRYLHRGDAEDVVQESFVILMERYGFEDTPKLKNLLYKIITSRAIDCLRREKQRIKHGRNVWVLQERCKERNPLEILISDETVVAIWAGIGELNSNRRETIELLKEGLKPSEISKIKGIDEQTTRSRIYEAREGLKRIFKRNNMGIYN